MNPPAPPATPPNTINSSGTAVVEPVKQEPVQPLAIEAAKTGSVVTLNYTLHTDSATGPIQETTLQTVAQENNLFKTGAKYQPFQVALGQNQVIYGFEQGLMGVKK